MTYYGGSCDVAVIGAGHAGIEAALAAARLGLHTILFTINLGNAIMTESSLSYLGIGISPPTATWGNMVYDAYAYLLKAPQLAIIPGVCIIVLIIAFNVVGDGLRDAFDPKMKR